jgi:hypothetical protein
MAPIDRYLAVCEHTWYQSERAGHDVGFAAAAEDFARLQEPPKPARRRASSASPPGAADQPGGNGPARSQP